MASRFTFTTEHLHFGERMAGTKNYGIGTSDSQVHTTFTYDVKILRGPGAATLSL